MAEELTRLLVLEQLQRLHTAFPSHTGMKAKPDATANVYHEGLLGLAGEALRAAVKVIIESDNYFPKVARLREVAWDWTRRHRVHIEPQTGDPSWCSRCQSHVRDQVRWKPRVDEHGFPVLKMAFDADSQVEVLLLDRFTRMHCDCASRCVFEPDDTLDVDYAAMRTSRIKWRYGRPGTQRTAAVVAQRMQWRTDAPRQLTPAGDVAERILEEAAVHADA